MPELPAAVSKLVDVITIDGDGKLESRHRQLNFHVMWQDDARMGILLVLRGVGRCQASLLSIIQVLFQHGSLRVVKD